MVATTTTAVQGMITTLRVIGEWMVSLAALLTRLRPTMVDASRDAQVWMVGQTTADHLRSEAEAEAGVAEAEVGTTSLITILTLIVPTIIIVIMMLMSTLFSLAHPIMVNMDIDTWTLPCCHRPQ